MASHQCFICHPAGACNFCHHNHYSIVAFSESSHNGFLEKLFTAFFIIVAACSEIFTGFVIPVCLHSFSSSMTLQPHVIIWFEVIQCLCFFLISFFSSLCHAVNLNLSSQSILLIIIIILLLSLSKCPYSAASS